MVIERTAEFDAFGPWVLEIDEPHEMPPLFKKYEYLIEDSLMIFKIPRKIERRHANPHMNLYDKVISVLENEVVILYRAGDYAEKITVELCDISIVSKTEFLLYGTIDLYIKDDIITFNYNTVSDIIIDKFLYLLRKSHVNDSITKSFKPIQFSYSDIGGLYDSLINRLTAMNTDFNLIAFQPNSAIELEVGMVSSFLNTMHITNNILHTRSTAFLSNGKELVTIDRSLPRNFDEKKDDSQHSLSYKYFQISNIKNAYIETFLQRPYLEKLVLEVGYHSFEYIIDSNNIGVDSMQRTLKNRY